MDLPISLYGEKGVTNSELSHFKVSYHYFVMPVLNLGYALNDKVTAKNLGDRSPKLSSIPKLFWSNTIRINFLNLFFFKLQFILIDLNYDEFDENDINNLMFSIINLGDQSPL